MKVRFFPDGVIALLALLGALSLADELWVAPTPVSLLRFLQAHQLWDVWNELRWEHMYSHEVLHFYLRRGWFDAGMLDLFRGAKEKEMIGRADPRSQNPDLGHLGVDFLLTSRVPNRS